MEAVLVLAAFVAPVAAAAQTADAVLSRAIAAYANVKTARASFEQTLTNPITGTTAQSHGEYVQQRPSRLSVRFTDPPDEQRDRIVADGSSVWVYVPSATPNQVVKMPIGAGTGAATVDFIGQLLTGPRDRFDVTDVGPDTVQGRHAHAITLVPKDEQAQFTKATIWVDDGDGVVRQFEVADANGTIRRIRLTSVAFNVPVDRSAFVFTPPPGVKVVDHNTMTGGTGL
jgi:outer membrane lipoprotein carrier protein